MKTGLTVLGGEEEQVEEQGRNITWTVRNTDNRGDLRKPVVVARVIKPAVSCVGQVVDMGYHMFFR